MLFIACHDQLRPGRYSVVTVVNGPTGNDWRCAWRRGYISTPPPMPVAARRPWLLGSCLYAVSDRRACEGIAAAARRIHRARRDSAQAEYDRRLLERWRCWRSR
jgi:hypothetical protein